ncbi:hypothetical protein JDV02_000060 [Purpureocillium takamizusanense]|uniref:Uncharacterized protein n=1 Tax=Purpureocillium takamizusanense TaxID=2060973 RepID=A0A9Q8Q6M1_9HYPO|nr:uncharacterized protein JDV02_000060 [Purpureocillium takamizusanense]UNI13303.1 hypothetical protein JDV02_000060 [Purpureocillium takamizusanense]
MYTPLFAVAMAMATAVAGKANLPPNSSQAGLQHFINTYRSEGKGDVLCRTEVHNDDKNDRVICRLAEPKSDWLDWVSDNGYTTLADACGNPKDGCNTCQQREENKITCYKKKSAGGQAAKAKCPAVPKSAQKPGDAWKNCKEWATCKGEVDRNSVLCYVAMERCQGNNGDLDGCIKKQIEQVDCKIGSSVRNPGDAWQTCQKWAACRMEPEQDIPCYAAMEQCHGTNPDNMAGCVEGKLKGQN